MIRVSCWCSLACFMLVSLATAQEADPQVFRTTVARAGDDGVHTYRIPGLAVSKAGTLLAVFDLRHKSAVDLPGDIDVGLKRSTDRGTTWGKTQTILDYDSSLAGSRGNGVGDPTILVDRETGRIFVAALYSLGNRAWFGSGPGLEPSETGQFVLTTSDDDGKTWSAPRSITKQIKDPAWKLCFQGPGAGIQTRSGRLVFPAQFKDAAAKPHSCFIWSDDHGENWKISPAAIPNDPPTSEAQIAELADGSLLLTMRDESKSGRRAWNTWTWDKTNPAQGSWGKHVSEVTDPTCMASLVSHPSGLLLFANPNHPKSRVALTIRTREDRAGAAWSEGRLLDPRGSMYSCLAVLDQNEIGVLYETVDAQKKLILEFARFPLSWATEPTKAPETKKEP